ncbi:MAG TPA: hypothetical protein VEX86_17320 [Longimicrobium sp.]|nr:hypothetical protein [Longimicrobium sp.]
MFEITHELDDSALTSVMYHVQLRIYERDRFPGPVARAERMHTVMMESELPLAPTVEAMVAEIEAHAGVPLEALTEERAGQYARQLGEISSARVRARPGYNPERGRRLLEEIRREYGYAA